MENGMRSKDQVQRGWSGVPVGPFASDPGWTGIAWWLGIPVAILVVVLASYAISPKWFVEWMEPEGYGVLELSHFFIPLTACALAVAAMFDPWVRNRTLVFLWLGAMALGTFYIGGEEHSWGQHFLKWNTPDYWSAINRQNETNLHNAFDFLGNGARMVLEVAIVLGGIIYPIVAWIWPQVRNTRLEFFMPPAALLPTAVIMIAIKIWGSMEKFDLVPIIAGRSSEVQETFIYLFLLFAVFVLRSRVEEAKEREAVAAMPA